jgi:hypothetical protein
MQPAQQTALPPAPAAAPADRFLPWAVRLAAAGVAVALLLEWCCGSRFPGGDEAGLINPAYMYCHHGRISYPIHGNWGYMVVHPPTYYAAAGLLMRAGVPPQQAAGLLCGALLLAFLAVLLASRLPRPAQLALLTGALPTLLGFGVGLFRPEVAIFLAWLGGVTALEAARRRGWDWRLLGLGGFCLATASGLHYWSFPAWTGALVYLAALAWELPARRALGRAAALAAGAALFAVPYLLLFLVPMRAEVKAMLEGTKAVGSYSEAYHAHLAAFALFPEWGDGPWRRLSTVAFTPSLAAGLPPLFVALAVLLLVPRCRLFVLAACPLPLFVALFVRRKLDTGYFLPEIFLYAVALAVLAGLAGARLLRRAGARAEVAGAAPAALALAVLAGAAVWVAGRVRLPLPPDRLEIARAASRELVGEGNVLVMNQLHKWYSGGGQDVLVYTVWGQGWDDFRRGLLTADATLVFHGDWFGNQRKAVPFPHWYLDGHLHLRGFFLARDRPAWRMADLEPLSSVFVAPRPTPRLVGYRLSDDGLRLERFEACPDGPEVFLAVSSAAPLAERFPELTLIRLPLEDPAVSQLDLFVGVCPRAAYEARAAELRRLGAVRDAVPGTLSPADAGALVARSRRDGPIRFHRTMAEAVAAVGPPEGAAPARPVALTPLREGVEGWTAGASAGRLVTTRSQDEWQLQADVAVEPHTLYRVRFGLGVEKGGGYVHAYDPAAGRYLFSLYRPKPQPEQDEAFVFDSGDAALVRLAVANNLPNGHPGRSRLTIRDFQIQKLRPSP